MCNQSRSPQKTTAKKKTVVILLGPTAVGKSRTASRLAEILNGEIINCDSMQVYQGFDIGTDKVSAEMQKNIPHHLVDILLPAQQFTAAEFVRLAVAAVSKILERERLPIITGGTGLYLKALISGLFPLDKRDPLLRKRLQKEAEQKGLEHLRNKLKKVDPNYYNKIGANDKIRIIRALEVFYLTKKPISEHFKETKPPLHDFKIIKIGLKLERKDLYDRIEKRVDDMFQRGIIEETKKLLAAGVPENAPPFRALGYKQVLEFLRGEINKEEAVSRIKTETRHYAKRQITWFKKMDGINWFNPEDLEDIVEFLHKSSKT
jgi:tRNA dimethylallyltransferase